MERTDGSECPFRCRYDLRPRIKRIDYFPKRLVKRVKNNFLFIDQSFNCENENSVTLNDLFPEEIMRLIFSFLPIHSKLQCRGVCKYWKNLSETLLKKETTISVQSIFGDKYGLVTYYKYLPPVFTRPMLKCLYKFCPNIEVIDMQGFYTIYLEASKQMSSITIQSPEENAVILRRLINFTDRNAKNLATKYASTLRSFNLHCGDHKLEIREISLLSVIKSCNKLEEIRIGRCSKITGRCFKEFKSTLKKLQLDFASDIWAGSTFGYLREIAGGESQQSLTSLDLKWNINPCCVNIIRYCNQIIPDLVQDPIELFSSRFSNLTVLKWDLPSVHNKPGNFKVLSHLTKLEELYLTGCDDYSFNDHSFIKVMTSCTNLSILEVTGICTYFVEHADENEAITTPKNLSDDSLTKIPLLCPSLKSFKLSWTRSEKISDNFLTSLASHCNLVNVTLEKLTNITEEGVLKMISLAKATKNINIADCSLLTKSATESLFAKLVKINIKADLTVVLNERKYSQK